MDTYLIVKTIHIVSSCILLGTGIGIAFFMFRSYFTDNINEKFFAVRNTVLADYIFTFPAVILQPVSGIWLVWKIGYEWSVFWLVSTYFLFAVIGFCWLPVVWIQIQLRRIIQHSMETKTELPKKYNRLMKIWFLFGWPAFFSLLLIFYLMVAKPV